MSNLFDSLTTEALVKAIQRNALILIESKKQKRLSNDQLTKVRQDLFFMRQEVIPRLQQLDRMRPDFFLADYHVTHQVYQPPQALDDWGPDTRIPERHGVVKGYTVDQVAVEFEGETNWTLVEPKDLKIKFIR